MSNNICKQKTNSSFDVRCSAFDVQRSKIKKDERPASNIQRRYAFLICLLLAASTLAVYGQTFKFDFLNYDDPGYVTENRAIQKGISWESVVWAFTAFHADNWHPITWLSHMADIEMFGLNPGMHHMTNLFFHIANTLLLFLIFRKMTRKTWQSGFVAALFALHPLHVQSVAWVAERKDVLSAFFWLLTIWGYATYAKKPGVVRYLPVIVFFAIGLMSKPMLVTLPFVLLMLDYWPLNRFASVGSDASSAALNRNPLYLIFEKIPLFILSAVSSGLTFAAQHQGEAVVTLNKLPLLHRLVNAVVSSMNYMVKMVYPSDLAAFYPYPGLKPQLLPAVAAILLILAVSFAALRVKKQAPYFIFGWLWYLITLVPVIGLVQVGMQSMADRYTYIPLIGLFVIIAWGVPELLGQWKHKKLCLSVSATLLLCVYSAVAWKQAAYWKNSITLWEHAIKVTRDNAIAHCNLGCGLKQKNAIKPAMMHFKEALRIMPDYTEAHTEMGKTFCLQGRIEQAIFHYRRAVILSPDNPKARINLATAYAATGQWNKAIPHYTKALKIDPENPQVHYNLGVAYYKNNQMEKAVQYFQKALALKPDYQQAKQAMDMIEKR